MKKYILNFTFILGYVFLGSNALAADVDAGNGTDLLLTRFSLAREEVKEAMNCFQMQSDLVSANNSQEMTFYLTYASQWLEKVSSFEFKPIDEWIIEKDEPKAAWAEVDQNVIKISRPYFHQIGIGEKEAFVTVVHESGHLLFKDQMKDQDFLDRVGIALLTNYHRLKNEKQYSFHKNESIQDAQKLVSNDGQSDADRSAYDEKITHLREKQKEILADLKEFGIAQTEELVRLVHGENGESFLSKMNEWNEEQDRTFKENFPEIKLDRSQRRAEYKEKRDTINRKRDAIFERTREEKSQREDEVRQLEAEIEKLERERNKPLKNDKQISFQKNEPVQAQELVSDGRRKYIYHTFMGDPTQTPRIVGGGRSSRFDGQSDSHKYAHYDEKIAHLRKKSDDILNRDTASLKASSDGEWAALEEEKKKLKQEYDELSKPTSAWNRLWEPKENAAKRAGYKAKRDALIQKQEALYNGKAEEHMRAWNQAQQAQDEIKALERKRDNQMEIDGHRMLEEGVIRVRENVQQALGNFFKDRVSNTINNVAATDFAKELQMKEDLIVRDYENKLSKIKLKEDETKVKLLEVEVHMQELLTKMAELKAEEAKAHMHK